MTVLYTCGKLPANQHDVVFLQVTINPAEQDEYDTADASFLERYEWTCVVHTPTRLCLDGFEFVINRLTVIVTALIAILHFLFTCLSMVISLSMGLHSRLQFLGCRQLLK